MNKLKTIILFVFLFFMNTFSYGQIKLNLYDNKQVLERLGLENRPQLKDNFGTSFYSTPILKEINNQDKSHLEQNNSVCMFIDSKPLTDEIKNYILKTAKKIFTPSKIKLIDNCNSDSCSSILYIIIDNAVQLHRSYIYDYKPGSIICYNGAEVRVTYLYYFKDEIIFAERNYSIEPCPDYLYGGCNNEPTMSPVNNQVQIAAEKVIMNIIANIYGFNKIITIAQNTSNYQAFESIINTGRNNIKELNELVLTEKKSIYIAALGEIGDSTSINCLKTLLFEKGYPKKNEEFDYYQKRETIIEALKKIVIINHYKDLIKDSAFIELLLEYLNNERLPYSNHISNVCDILKEISGEDYCDNLDFNNLSYNSWMNWWHKKKIL